MTIRFFATLTLCLAVSATSAGTALAQQPTNTSRRQRPAPPQTPAPPAQPAPPATQVVTPPPPQPPPLPAPRHEGQPINVKVDVTITDQRGTAPPSKKTVSVVSADGMTGSIRYTASYFTFGQLPLNVDAEPQLLRDGKIRVRLNLQYELPVSPGDAPRGEAGPVAAPSPGAIAKTAIHENLALIVENGKSMVAAQSADPAGDRQVTIELKATVLR